MMAVKILWWITLFLIIEAMVGYPLSLLLLRKGLHIQPNRKDYSYEPPVTVMVVAHNEEKVILEKLNNLQELHYPPEKIKVLVTSDCSTDNTNAIVRDFIAAHPGCDIRLHETVEHKGKTNAQNEAQRLVDTELLILTDANAMLDRDAVRELAASFSEENIAYVSGQLVYLNTDDNSTANSEGIYWKMDLMCREIESELQTITAGNGAIYAVRNDAYIEIPPVECHDSSFPVLFALQRKRAIYNKDAIAYEKAGEIDEDEFKRKVRMNRDILREILPDVSILNVSKYKWFSYFYFGHRTCRYLLWALHIILLALTIALLPEGLFWKIMFAAQIAFYSVAAFGWACKVQNRIVRMMTYYCMTIAAQCKGVINILTGRSKPVWEKAESTRE
ncbi:MAG: glycosyltransferase family 2 protein [Lachnospiraceae bacterium]|nr:glycosyltransferase family 2 protein [Lachnospiraceae bacterium]